MYRFPNAHEHIVRSPHETLHAKFKYRLIAPPPNPPDIGKFLSLNLYLIHTTRRTSMQFSDEYSFIVVQRVAEATKQAIKRKIVQAASVDFQSRSLPTKPKPSVISGGDIANLFACKLFRHAPTFLQWDLGGWSLVRWRSQHVLLSK